MTALRVLDLSPAELVVRLRQQELVAQFGVLALSSPGIDAVIDRACTVAAEGLQTQFAKALRFRPATNDFLVVAGLGWRPGVVGHAVLGAGLDSPAGYALQMGAPTRAGDLGTEQRFKVPPLLAEHDIHSAINVPVPGEGDVPFGVLEVDSTNRHEFVETDTNFLQSVGNVLSAAITRAAAETAKDALLRDKDLLMQEVHHRVKNSLQLVRTLLQLQARTAEDGVREKLDEAAQRIMTIGAVHQRLYEGGSVVETDAGIYLAGLLDDMRPMLADDGSRPIVLHADDIKLPADQVTPLGLIVSELVTNAAKHGQGQITVTVRRAEPGVEVVVSDEGPGFPDGVMPRGLGMRLITALAKGDATRAVHIDRTANHGRIAVTLTL